MNVSFAARRAFEAPEPEEFDDDEEVGDDEAERSVMFASMMALDRLVIDM